MLFTVLLSKTYSVWLPSVGGLFFIAVYCVIPSLLFIAAWYVNYGHGNKMLHFPITKQCFLQTVSDQFVTQHKPYTGNNILTNV